MAKKDIQTNLVVSAETKGLDEARQKQARFNKESSQALKDQTKGFVEAQKSSTLFIKNLDEISDTDFANIQKHSDKLKSKLKGLLREQVQLNLAMAEVDDKASPAYKKLEDNLGDVESQAKDTSKSIGLIEKAYSSQFDTMRKGHAATKRMQDEARKSSDSAAKEAVSLAKTKRQALFQGLAQGGLPFPAPFLQRGPGMKQQIGGMIAGKALTGGYRAGRSVAGGLAGAAYSGVGGLAQGVSQVPYVGGFLGGQIQAAGAAAQQHRQWQGAQLGAAPILGGGDVKGARKKLGGAMARLKASQGARKRTAQKQIEKELAVAEKEKEERIQKASTKFIKDPAKQKQVADDLIKQQRETEARLDRWKKRAIKKKIAKKGTVSGDPSTVEAQAAKVLETPEMKKDTKKMKKARAEVTRRLAELNKAKMGDLSNIAGMGVNLLGVSKPEALQKAQQVIQAGGGTARDTQGIVPQAFAAQTLYGVGAQTSGAFLQGGRRGGLVGGKGRGGEAFTEGIQEAFELGLSRTEMPQYLERIAQGIMQFQTTGIPFNKDSMSSLAQEIGDTGITGTRAVEIAGGLQQYIQTMGQRGITGGADLLSMQVLGGYKGGGSEEYLKAMTKMESAKYGLQGVDAYGEDMGVGSDMKTLLQEFMRRAGGGQAQQTLALKARLQKMGVNMGFEEATIFGKRLTGAALTDEEQLKVNEEQARKMAGAKTAAGLGRAKGSKQTGLELQAQEAVSLMAPSVKTQARIANQRISVGGKVVGAMDKLELSSLNVNKSFAHLAAGPLKHLATGLNEATTKIDGYVQKLKDVTDITEITWDAITGTGPE